MKFLRDEKGRFIKGNPSAFKKGYIMPVEIRKKISKKLKGRHLSEKTKNKISKALKGRKGTWKGKHFSKETRKKMSEARSGEKNPNYGKHLSVEWRKKLSKSHKGKHHTREQIRKCLTRRIPTSLEIQFQQIIDKFNLPYKYVGDGKFFIERYNPDFINTNGEKIAIEVYARYYKRKHGSIEDWKKNRSKVFRKYGWNIIYFSEIELNEENVLKNLQRGD